MFFKRMFICGLFIALGITGEVKGQFNCSLNLDQSIFSEKGWLFFNPSMQFYFNNGLSIEAGILLFERDLTSSYETVQNQFSYSGFDLQFCYHTIDYEYKLSHYIGINPVYNDMKIGVPYRLGFQNRRFVNIYLTNGLFFRINKFLMLNFQTGFGPEIALKRSSGLGDVSGQGVLGISYFFRK